MSASAVFTRPVLWLATRVYRATPWRRLREAYFQLCLRLVRRRPAGGGEYPNQDGFGWTNGVTLKMSVQEKAAERRENPRPEEAPQRVRETAGARR